MHCMAWLHEEPVYQLLVLLLLQTHLKTVILDIFSWMDFNVFYCNLVNILIHIFFSHYWFAAWVLPGWGLGREGDWNTPALSLAVSFSHCMTNTAGELTTWDPGLLLQPQGPRHASGTVAEQRTDFMVGQPLRKGSWQTHQSLPCLSYLRLHVNSWVWVWCFNTPIFCLELWRKLKHQWHICLLSFCSGQWWLGNKWRHTELKLEQISSCYQGRKSIRKWNANATVGYGNTANPHPGGFLTVTGKMTSVWGSGCHQYCVTPSTVQWSQIRWGSATLFRQNPANFFKETIQDQQFHLHFKRLLFI